MRCDATSKQTSLFAQNTTYRNIHTMMKNTRASCQNSPIGPIIAGRLAGKKLKNYKKNYKKTNK